MVCHACGKSVQTGDRFCNWCGTPLIAAEQEITAVAVGEDGVDGGTTTDATDAVDEPDTDVDPELPGAPVPPDEHAESLARADTAETAAATIDARTELLPVLGGDDEWGDFDPVWAATAATPEVVAGSVSTADLPATEPITEVWMESVPAPVDTVQPSRVQATTATPHTASATSEMPIVVVSSAPPTSRFRVGAVTLIGILTGAVTMVALFATMVTVTSTARLTIGPDAPLGFRTGSWIADDLADNLSIAGLIAIVSVVAGGVAAAFGWRWGSGLAGGAGLAIAGLATLTIGLAQRPIDAAHEFVLIPSDQPFTLTITRDLGYWLLIGAGSLGVVLFFASINDAFGERRPGLNPWIAALGALATLVAAGGPLLPENLAVFSDNWYLTDGPGQPSALLLVGRLVQLGAFALTGIVGYLSVRRWGLGVAIGGAMPLIWLALSTLFDVTSSPVGPGFRNPGATDMHLHGVTIIGMSAVAALSVLAVIAAYDQGVRERRAPISAVRPHR